MRMNVKSGKGEETGYGREMKKSTVLLLSIIPPTVIINL